MHYYCTSPMLVSHSTNCCRINHNRPICQCRVTSTQLLPYMPQPLHDNPPEQTDQAGPSTSPSTQIFIRHLSPRPVHMFDSPRTVYVSEHMQARAYAPHGGEESETACAIEIEVREWRAVCDEDVCDSWDRCPDVCGSVDGAHTRILERPGAVLGCVRTAVDAERAPAYVEFDGVVLEVDEVGVRLHQMRALHRVRECGVVVASNEEFMFVRLCAEPGERVRELGRRSGMCEVAGVNQDVTLRERGLGGMCAVCIGDADNTKSCGICVGVAGSNGSRLLWGVGVVVNETG